MRATRARAAGGLKREKYDAPARGVGPVTLDSLREVLSSEYRGPRSVLSEVHVLRAILAIGAEGSVGRGRLGTLVGLGQGEVRTLIRRMKGSRLIAVQPGGCTLTRKGAAEYHLLIKKIPWSSPVSASALGIGERCFAVLVRGADSNLRMGIEQRDAAVRTGAQGALTAVFSRGRFKLPGEGVDCEKGGPRELWQKARGAGPIEGDVLVVVGAETDPEAELGALATALTLL